MDPALDILELLLFWRTICKKIDNSSQVNDFNQKADNAKGLQVYIFVDRLVIQGWSRLMVI